MAQKLIKRADGRYRRSISLGHDPETGRPIRKYVYGRTIAEVNEAVKDVKEEIVRGDFVLGKQTTVSEFSEHWIKATINPKRSKSFAQYAGLIKNYIKPLLGNVPLNDLRTIHISEAITKIESTGKKKTAVQFRAAMKQILTAAEDEDLVRRNVASRTKKPAYSAQVKQPLSDKEIEQLLNADLSNEERLFVCLCLFQGMRRGEALGIMRITTNQINISSTWCSVNNRPDIRAVPKTTAGNRVFNIMSITQDAINAVQDSHKRLYLFSNEDGSLYTEEHYKWMWNRIMTKFNLSAGGVAPMGRRSTLWAVPRITSHYLRHTYATMLYYAKFDVLQMQYLLGHTDIVTTLGVYTHMDKESLGIKDRYTKWAPLMRECFLKERREKLCLPKKRILRQL